MNSKNPNPTVASCRFQSPLGTLVLAATFKGLRGLWFEGQRHMPDSASWPEQSDHTVLVQARQELDEYFSGQRHVFALPLDLSYGTDFQQTVWQALGEIPFGKTQTYGGLSQQLGRPSAVRAVAAAIGRNPISIVVPCHRVLGADGSLTGYAGGLARKQALLHLEVSSGP
jgi:methylated-DNA-[protein]-cysteine S-methyltransferase